MPIREFEPCDTYRLIIFRTSEKAFLVAKTVEDKEKAFWLPKSQIEMTNNGEKTGTHHVGEFTIPDWLAEKNGLI